MRLRTLGAAAALALALPVAGQATDFNYSFIDAALAPHAEIEAQNQDIDGKGFQVRGSLAVNPNLFVIAQLQGLDLDYGVDATRLMVGGGGHWPIANNVDFVGTIGVSQLNVDYGRNDDDDTGIFLGAKVRASVAPRVEIEGGVEYSSAEVGNSGNDVYLIGEGRYNFNERFSVGGLINYGSDTELVGVTARLSF